MLIYRNDGKLHSISKKALKIAGYHDIAQFLGDHNDYSELFVKKPGYIYNFENFSWLSFLRNATTQQKKVLIATNDKATYECELELETLFPVTFDQNTPEFYYQITFKNMRLLAGSGDSALSIDLTGFETETVEEEIQPAITEAPAAAAPAETMAQGPEEESEMILFGESPAEEKESETDEFEIVLKETPPETPAPSLSAQKEEALELVDFSFEDEKAPAAEPAVTEEELPLGAERVQEEMVPEIGLKEEPTEASIEAPAFEEEPKPAESTEPKGEKAELSIEMPDIRKVSGTLGLPETMVKAFIREFVDTYFNDLDEVKAAIGAEKPDIVRKEAMKLKGIAANLMMSPLVQILEEVLSAKEQSGIESAWNGIDRYMKELAALYASPITQPPSGEPIAETAVAEEAEESKATKTSKAEETAQPGETAKKLRLDMTEGEETIEFDPSEAANALGLPESLIVEFVNDFIQQAKEEKANFEKHFEMDDIKTINEIAHKLKGVAANLRIEDMRQLMENAQHAKTPEEVEKSLRVFYRKLAALTKSMAKEYA
ncbi:Hpt domain-containing protein [Hydrogenimonas urashimensis]|uniref:Hpt domain-containing protein n=1 Tax=Hydrogenimonas urashimensis TaxID=2740515 RepID=UPI001916AB7B|nr:Hpt domain-containing protein [Hydrogenimonas urashimensis]